MKKFFLSLVLSAAVVTAYAHVPTDISVEYSHSDKTLIVKFVHISSERQKDYIREIDIIRGDGEVKETFYTMQYSALDVVKKIPIALDPGEKIQVNLYCNQGPSAGLSYLVPEEENASSE